MKEKDRSRIPTLDWNRKREGKTVVAPLLSTVEKIDPAAWIDTLRREPRQGDMFGSFDRYENPDRGEVGVVRTLGKLAEPADPRVCEAGDGVPA